jgi:hypothetical protein
MKRNSDALAITEGACNPSGIAHAIISACREIRDQPGYSGTDMIRQDPAIRLMVHQLAYLCGVAEIDGDVLTYGKLLDACKPATNGEREGKP